MTAPRIRSRCPRSQFTLVLAILAGTLGLPARAQQTPAPPTAPFPAWMDEVRFQRPAVAPPGQLEPMTPQEPTDPDPAGSRQPPAAGGLFRRPSLPDFRTLREKALRVEMRRDASGTLRLEQQQVTTTDVETWERRRAALATEARNVGPAERAGRQRELDSLTARLRAAQELAGLLPPQDAATASLSPLQKQRVQQLQLILFPPTESPTTASDPFPATTTGASTPVRIPAGFYRPARRTFLFEERRQKAQQEASQTQEE